MYWKISLKIKVSLNFNFKLIQFPRVEKFSEYTPVCQTCKVCDNTKMSVSLSEVNKRR